MITLNLEQAPAAVNVKVTEEKLTVDLADGRSIVIPIEWFPRLAHATAAERDNWQLLGDGYAIEWLEMKPSWSTGFVFHGRSKDRAQLPHDDG